VIYPRIDIVNNFPYIINRKTSQSIIIWIMLLLLFFLIFLIIAFNYKYSNYETYLGYVIKNESEYNIVLYVEKNKINSLYNCKLLIEKEAFNFKIKSISKDYYIISNTNYYEVILDINLKENWKIENNILNITLEKPKTTIYKQIKKGIEMWKN